MAAIVEPTRRRLLAVIGADQATVGELVAATGVSQPAVSKHLRALREAGVVRVRVEGPLRWYRVEPEPLQEMAAWLETFRPLWAGRLDELQRYLGRHPSDEPAKQTEGDSWTTA